MNEEQLRIETIALLVGVSTQTLNNWYRWKKIHPEHELAHLLPDYQQDGLRQTRYWKSDDVWKIIDFKHTIPHGRFGILGDITQKQARKRKELKSCQD